MANNFGVDRAYLAKKFVPVLDEVYKTASKTSILDGAAELAREGANANELIIPMLAMDGLANYSRDNGYVDGDVTMTNATYKCNYDRGRMFSVDNLDNQESFNIAFGRLAGEFIRTKVVPELDAWRLSTYAAKSGIGAVESGANLTTAANLISALRKGLQTMDNAEVPYENRVLFIASGLHDLIDDQDLTKSNKALSAFSQIVKMPQGRFHEGVQLTANGAGGFTTTGAALNFMIVHKPAVIQYQKHVAPKVIAPDQNQKADAWKYGYRTVGIADVYANKVLGIYKHMAPTSTT